MKVLLIDDSDAKAETLATCIKECEADASIRRATSAADAFTMLLGGRFDLVLLDVLLPMRAASPPSEDASIWFVREVQRKANSADFPLIVGTTQYAESFAKVQETFRHHLWSVVLVTSEDSRWRAQISYAARFARSKQARASLSSALPGNVDVALVTALRIPEYEAVVSALGGGERLVLQETGENWLRCDVDSGAGQVLTAVAATSDEMGMCAMATLVTRIVVTCRPKVVMLAGIMGGNAARVSISDLVLIEESWDWRAGKITERGFEPDVKVQRCSFKLANSLRASITEDVLSGLRQRWTAPKPRVIPQMYSGAVACSPSVVADCAVFAQMEAQKRKVYGVEMEAFGCYDAAHRLGDVAPAVIAVKSVCDLGDKGKSDEYHSYCAYLAAAACVAALKDARFVEGLPACVQT